MKQFSQIKQDILRRKDKSDIGEIDSKIRGLCQKINKNKNYYTTSSCAGRIILIKNLEKKVKNVFLFKTHEKISFLQMKKELEKARKSKNVYFKQETCILHVACSDLNSAQILLDKAKFAGWKRSGIMATRKRFVLELMSTEKLELPAIANEKILIDDNFLKILVKEANSRLERVWEKIDKLEKLI
ncbi:hypothetical protein FJZ19_02125 [Candidatus Pacearchaeota archaeon]|nr:hypothetical protein [Candidatus Pacearchaeota archaeon]